MVDPASYCWGRGLMANDYWGLGLLSIGQSVGLDDLPRGPELDPLMKPFPCYLLRDSTFSSLPKVYKTADRLSRSRSLTA